MSTDDFVQINVTDSELQQQTISSTLRLHEHIQQEIPNPNLHQIQKMVDSYRFYLDRALR